MAPSKSESSGMFCGMGCDEVFAYQTQKIVAIKDRRLGWMKLFFMGIILGYIVIYKLICQCRYLMVEAPVGTVRFSLREPTISKLHGPSCDPVKYRDCVIDNTTMKPVHDYRYCNQSGYNTSIYGLPIFPCVYWDSIEAKNVQDKSLLITTHVQEMNQTRDSCSLDPTTTNVCPHLWNNENAKVTDSYLAGIETFTLLIDHAVNTPSIGIGAASRNMTGVLYVASDDNLCETQNGVDLNNEAKSKAPCYLHPKLSKSLDYFTLETLMRAGEIDLEKLATAGQSYRYEGCVVLLEITYTNWKEWTGPWDWSDFPHVKTNSINYIYKLSLIPSSSYKFETVVYNSQSERLVKTKSGMRIAVLQTGQLGKFDFQTLLVQLTASLGLLAVATTVVDFVATKLLKDKKTYKSSKYEESKVLYKPDSYDKSSIKDSIYEDDALLVSSVN